MGPVFFSTFLKTVVRNYFVLLKADLKYSFLMYYSVSYVRYFFKEYDGFEQRLSFLLKLFKVRVNQFWFFNWYISLSKTKEWNSWTKDFTK